MFFQSLSNIFFLKLPGLFLMIVFFPFIELQNEHVRLSINPHFSLECPTQKTSGGVVAKDIDDRKINNIESIHGRGIRWCNPHNV